MTIEEAETLIEISGAALNRGVPGVDGMQVRDLKEYLREEWPRIKEELLNGTYQPQPVRKVEIPKPGGGMRMLGIPTVLDRLIQQALHQELVRLFDPDFSESSYGFRPGRSAHQAVQAARRHVAEGRRWVVDIDLERFFNRVGHDVLMARVARKVKDQRVLQLIRRYLTAGVLEGGRRHCFATGGRNAARRAVITALVEHSARRTRQGTGAARSCVLPLRRRLQHLRSQSPVGRTSDGFADPVP